MDEPETTEGRVIYEQDLRAASHSNGRAPDLVEPKVTADGGATPPELPDEPEYHRPEGGGQSKLLAYSLAFIYLGAACLSAYVGITMIRDLRGKKEKKT
jgi:hypothetical protein